MAASERPFLLTKPTAAQAPAAIDRAHRLAWWDVQRTDINQKIDASADPTHSHWINKFYLNEVPVFLRGRVVDSIAYTNCHKVQFGMWGTMWCQMITPTATQPMGARHIGQLPVGCEVLVLWYNEDSNGIIIGVIPDPQRSSKGAMVDFISQQARSGLLVDEAHNYPIKLKNASLIIDWSAGRPFDATTEGEQGNITETGLLDFIDSFMATKRVDEECGIWTFWHDQLTRLAGHNLQVWTAGYEREDLDDEGEFDKVEGHTPYYWEALGAFEFGLKVSRDIPTKCWQKDPELQGYSATEPCDDHQLAFYRLRDFYGYLGQAHKRVLCLPPTACSSSALPEMHFDDDQLNTGSSETCHLSSCVPHNLNLLHKELIYPGVFEEDLALTGRWAVRSAHEIVLSKHVLIPAPKQMIRPEDPKGDNKDNYHAAGLDKLGHGNEHKVKGEIEVPHTDDDPTQIRAAGFLDTHAFIFNWIGDHPFYYHEHDWYLPEETDLKYLSKGCRSVAFEPPRFDELSCHQFLEAPPAIPIKVDHRYKEVKYYPNHSYFALLADGGIVLGDGFGSEIKLANGSIWITTPGDVMLQSGRDVIAFAGYDVVLRAKNSWDISATKHDGRLKANRNLWMVASGECGGILIESNAKKPYCDFKKTGEEATLGGIVIKAEDSLITQCAKDMCFKLSKTDEDEHVLIFDTGWKGRLKFKSRFFERFMAESGAALDFWVKPGGSQCKGSVKRGAEHWMDGTLLCSPLVVNDNVLVNGCVAANDDLVSTNGHVITKKAKQTQSKVGILKAKGPQDDLEEKFKYYTERCHKLPEIGDHELDILCKRQEKYSCCDAEFSFRTVKQYRTDDFVLFESRWQQIARIGKVKTNTWEEEPVRDTYPYPGKEKLLGETFRTMDPKLYNIKTSVAEGRGSKYEDPEFDEPKKEILNEKYAVII